MSRTTHDSPYRDDPSPRADPAHTHSRPARKSKQPRKQDSQRKPSAAHAARSRNGPNGSHAARASHDAARPKNPPRGAHAHERRPAASSGAAAATVAPAGRRRSRRRGHGGGGAPPLQLTSHPTGRAAYADTRAWLLKQHGPICAYCAREFKAEVMTLDHVAPRRGQTAYDRRDNLVLACRPCNEAKRDLSPLAYLLAVRARAANLIRYGAHLSPGLLDLARSLVQKHHHHAHEGNGHKETNGKRSARDLFGAAEDGGESPYKD